MKQGILSIGKVLFSFLILNQVQGLDQLPFDSRVWESVESIHKWQDKLNQMPAPIKFHYFHLFHPNNYYVFNKKAGEISFYQQGDELPVDKIPALFPFVLNDRKVGSPLLKGEQIVQSGLAAGIYTILEVLPQEIVLQDDKNRKVHLWVGSDTINFFHSSFTSKAKFYVLPSEQGHVFIAKNNRLNFASLKKHSRYDYYRFSPRYKDIHENQTLFRFKPHKKQVVEEYMATLDEEKLTLMKLYQVDNEEYNRLAGLAFGILGNESEFGESIKLILKEAFPALVAILKGNLTTRYNSRGLTQIKTIPELIKKKYRIKKSDLMNPRDAAIATLGFLAQSLRELRFIEKRHKDIRPYNRHRYLHYIYTGRVSQIKKGLATPDKNIYFQNILRYQSYIQLLQKRLPIEH